MKQYRIFALVLSANFETLAYMGGAWYLGSYLNERYPQNHDWFKLTCILGLLLIGRSWYVVFRLLMQSQKNSSQDTNSDKKPPVP